MKRAVQWLGIASWFIGLLAAVAAIAVGYHRFVLANASYQQLLVEKQQLLQAQEIQLHDARKQRGMLQENSQ